MPMIWLDLKEAGEFQFSPAVRQVSWVGERSNRAEGESQPNRDYGRLDISTKMPALASVK